jgi:hypothetical protein
MDPIRDSRDQRLEESRRSLHIGTFDRLRCADRPPSGASSTSPPSSG